MRLMARYCLIGQDPRQVYPSSSRLMDHTGAGPRLCQGPVRRRLLGPVLGKAIRRTAGLDAAGRQADRWRSDVPGRAPGHAAERSPRRSSSITAPARLPPVPDQGRHRLGQADIETHPAHGRTAAEVRARRRSPMPTRAGRVDQAAARRPRLPRSSISSWSSPASTYEECQQVRARTDLPMKLDECITDIHMIQRRIVQDRVVPKAMLPQDLETGRALEGQAHARLSWSITACAVVSRGHLGRRDHHRCGRPFCRLDAG